MITYRYGPYKPEDDSNWDTDKLMGLLSEMVMRNDMRLEDALRSLINQGLPVNLFLKEGGMQDLVQQFLGQLEQQKNSILDDFSLQEAIKEAEEDMKDDRDSFEKRLRKNKDLKQEFDTAMDRASVDALYQIKWDILKKLGGNALQKDFDNVIRNLEDYNTILEGDKKFQFKGKEPLTKAEALQILKQLEDLDKLQEALAAAAENGDLFNFNLEKLARYLGPESYQEFLERREEILRKLQELLEKQGKIVRNDESGEYELSPQSIRKIGRRVLEHVFKGLYSDSAGGNHETPDEGESENAASHTRKFQFGDAISHIDISASVTNALIRSGQSKPSFNDLEIFEARGSAKSHTVILLDMSGSMMRADRFYNAKKMVLALDALIRQDYKDDRLTVVGFGTLAKIYSPVEIPTLQPFPVTIFDPYIRLKISMAGDKKNPRVPLYFTNLHRALQLGRSILGGGETKNKQIILITDGVPTAHNEGSHLLVNYPPSPADFDFALREVKACNTDGIVINTFLLTSDWEVSYFGEESFIRQFAKQSQGRIFFPDPRNLGQLVLIDFIEGKKSKLAV